VSGIIAAVALAHVGNHIQTAAFFATGVVARIARKLKPDATNTATMRKTKNFSAYSGKSWKSAGAQSK
jgi:hypothetical protein